MPKTVIKRDKNKEIYDPDKVKKSLERIHVSPETISEILKKIEKELPEIITTKKLYDFVFKNLYQKEQVPSYKYNLKRAIFNLGPTGYPFEKFIAHLFKLYGYSAHHNLFLKGKCLSYEIDFQLEKDNKIWVGECKFHQNGLKKNDLKIILYVYGRFLDLKDKIEKESIPLIVTNTKFTAEAIEFSTCYNIQLISWDYPEENLPYLIETKKAYPLTIFPFLSFRVLQNFFNYDIVLITDFLSKDKNYLRKISGLSFEEIDRIFKEGEKLIH